jgi:hypothetical protein
MSGIAGNGYQATLLGMFELSVTTSSSDEDPSIGS